MKTEIENTHGASAGADSHPSPSSPFFVFDVESIGLHGQAFAVAGGIYTRDGSTLREFAFHCHESRADGEMSDRVWVNENVTVSSLSAIVECPRDVRSMFWRVWADAKETYPGITMAVECGWPVEARFLNACIDDDRGERNWSGPYPMHEIASIMLAAGMDPMATYERLPKELPAHEPLADARQSARLLATALKSLVNDESSNPDRKQP
ncbi:MAG: hypothetical protein IT576_02095 [Verrucomicrobiales bacterium]|nr:hypothetical protein [Verrucomicrobiales bacterium]